MADVVFAEGGEISMDPQVMRGLLETLGISAWQFDPSDQVVTWRPGVAARDLARSAVIREPLADLLKRYQSEDRPRLAAHYEEAFRTGGSGPVRFRVRRRSGALIYIESVAITARSPHGGPILQGLMRDCRHDVVSEQAISGLNSLMQQLVDHSRHAIIVTDGDEKIRNYNNNVHRFLALDAKLDLHKSKIGVLGALRHIDLHAVFEEVFYSGRDLHKAIEVEIGKDDRRRFGLWAYRWFRPNARPGGVVVRIENTDETRTLEARDATRRMMDALPDIYLVFDKASGLFRFANRAARERLGLRMENLGAHSAAEKVFSRDAFKRLREALETAGTVSDVEATLTSYAGPDRHVSLSAANATWENEPSIVVAARPAPPRPVGNGLRGLLSA